MQEEGKWKWEQGEPHRYRWWPIYLAGMFCVPRIEQIDENGMELKE